jgi:hypothetical protein
MASNKGLLFTEEQYQFLKGCKKENTMHISNPSPEHQKILEELLKEDLVEKTNRNYTSYTIKKEAYKTLRKEWWFKTEARFMVYMFFHPDRPLTPRKYPNLKRWQRW